MSTLNASLTATNVSILALFWRRSFLSTIPKVSLDHPCLRAAYSSSPGLGANLAVQHVISPPESMSERSSPSLPGLVPHFASDSDIEPRYRLANHNEFPEITKVCEEHKYSMVVAVDERPGQADVPLGDATDLTLIVIKRIRIPRKQRGPNGASFTSWHTCGIIGDRSIMPMTSANTIRYEAYYALDSVAKIADRLKGYFVLATQAMHRGEYASSPLLLPRWTPSSFGMQAWPMPTPTVFIQIAARPRNAAEYLKQECPAYRDAPSPLGDIMPHPKVVLPLLTDPNKMHHEEHAEGVRIQQRGHRWGEPRWGVQMSFISLLILLRGDRMNEIKMGRVGPEHAQLAGGFSDQPQSRQIGDTKRQRTPAVPNREAQGHAVKPGPWVSFEVLLQKRLPSGGECRWDGVNNRTRMHSRWEHCILARADSFRENIHIFPRHIQQVYEFAVEDRANEITVQVGDIQRFTPPCVKCALSDAAKSATHELRKFLAWYALGVERETPAYEGVFRHRVRAAVEANGASHKTVTRRLSETDGLFKSRKEYSVKPCYRNERCAFIGTEDPIRTCAANTQSWAGVRATTDLSYNCTAVDMTLKALSEAVEDQTEISAATDAFMDDDSD